ncbi:MAG: hypothetical protein IJY89_02445 [Clostridia bacterium]|nr:hypothetical protein [Clostridia bacterium]
MINTRCIKRTEQELLFEDLFLSALIPHLTTIREQAYNDEELQRLSKALEGKIPFSLPAFITVKAHHLEKEHKKALSLAREFLNSGTISDQSLFDYDRKEFQSPQTVPDALTKDLLYLLWMAKMPERVLVQVGLSKDVLEKKIEHLCALLGGEEPIFAKISVNGASLS